MGCSSFVNSSNNSSQCRTIIKCQLGAINRQLCGFINARCYEGASSFTKANHVTNHFCLHSCGVGTRHSCTAMGTTQRRSTHIAQTKGHSLVGVGADLEAGIAHGAVQQLLATEGGGFSNTGQLTGQRGELLVQRGALGLAVGTVGRLQSQVTHTLHDVGGFLHRTFSGLGDGDTVVGVLDGNVQTIDLAGQTVGDLQAGGVVLGAVDLGAGSQALQGGGQVAGRSTQVTLGVQRSNVAVYCKGHG